MFIDLLAIIGGINISIITYVLGSISYVIPTFVQDALSYVFGGMRYFSGILPMDTVFQVLTAFIVFYSVIYGIKAVKFVIGFIPFFKH